MEPGPSEDKEKIRVIRKDIIQILPDLDVKTAQEVARYIYELGFHERQDLKFIKLEDLSDKLNRVHCRKLLASWQTVAANDQQKTATKGTGKRSSYIIKWNKIPDHLMTRIEKGQSITNTETDKIVQLIVDDVRATVQNVNRSFFNGVAAEMASKYPRAFKDMTVLGNKCGTLTTEEKLKYKMKNKWDNDNRKNRSKRHLVEVEAPSRPEAYGCLRWQVLELPEEETNQSLELKQKEMQDIFNLQKKREWNWKIITPLLQATYCLQRKDINGQIPPKRTKKNNETSPSTSMSTTDILIKWPFLFIHEGMLQHFLILTGKNFKEALKTWLSECQQDFIDFLAKKNETNEKIRGRMHRAKMQNSVTDPEATAIILMLSIYLKENIDMLLQVFDGGITMAKLEAEVDIPATPLIIASGPSAFRARKYYICMDGKVRGTAKHFSKALGLLFCAYYVFNLKYADNISLTLEFIQRSILDINPDTGSKAPSKKNTKAQRSFKLSVLAAEFTAYQSKVNDG